MQKSITTTALLLSGVLALAACAQKSEAPAPAPAAAPPAAAPADQTAAPAAAAPADQTAAPAAAPADNASQGGDNVKH